MKFIAPLHVRRLVLLSALGAFLLTGTAGLAVQPQANMPATVLSPASPQPVRAATGTQQKLAATAEAEGVQIEWHAGLGTPFSIRGKDLGARQPFSAGRGLQAAQSAPPEANAIAVLDNLSGIMGIREAQNEFAAQPAQGDTLGFRHVRTDQIYQGLKVFGGEVIVHFNQEGEAYQVNGRYVPDIAVDVKAQITSDDAMRLATEDLAGLGKSGVLPLSQPELMVFAYKTAPRLAYALTLTADPQEANAWRYWIDAQDGKVLMRYNDVKSVDIAGAILTGEGGTTNTVTNCIALTGTNYLKSTNWMWQIHNASSNTIYVDHAVTPIDTDSIATNIACRLINATNFWTPEDRTEMSAAGNFNNVQQYYWWVQGRNSYDANGTMANVYVHYGDNYNNAFWSPTNQAWFFGDGDSNTFTSLAVLDVCAHEYTHAVTEHTANLIYAYESGALNESFSDIFGACVEFNCQPNNSANYPSKTAGTADWLLGEDCTPYTNTLLAPVALRDMRDPGNSITVGLNGKQPSYYKGAYWYSGSGDNGGVHQNSGVQNHFFYLLCDGANGIGVGATERIAYRALTVYCSQYTDYTDIRTAWLSAAQDLIGLFPTGPAAVVWAWGQVGCSSDTVADLGTALNATYLTWYVGGHQNWFAESNTTHDSVLAAQSGDITDFQQSRLQTIITGPGTLSFRWKVSSEAGWDFLRFFDGTNQLDAISGEQDWALYSVSLSSGTHTNTWNYTKDSSVSSGQDAGWVDEVSWAPTWTPVVPPITATKGDYADRINISWSAIGGANDYWLYRHTIDNSAQAQLVATVTSPAYDDYGVVPGTVYYYWMKARNCATFTSLSGVDSGSRNLLPPTGLAASKGAYTGSVRLTWVAATGATSYRIMRSTSSDPNTATAIVETGATSYLDTTALPAVTYYYWLTSRKWRPEGMLTTPFSVGDYGWRRSMAATDNAFCDFDGDGKADPAVYQRATGHWMIMMSGNHYRTMTFELGGTGYLPVPQDFDGDGKTDIAVYSQATGLWIVLLSASGYNSGTASLGGPGYIPLARDFDGDGRADPAAFHRPSGLWKIPFSSRSYAVAEGYFGDSAYSPCPADYDNDGITDPAVFQVRTAIMGRMGYLLTAQSASGYAVHTWTIGISGQTAPQDYDGDAKADPALYDAAAGLLSFWPSSILSSMPFSFTIGGAGFVPVAGDYDGDNKADPAVYQESTGTWIIRFSGSDYAPATEVFGGSGYEAAATLPYGD
ncbi:MAG: M4 family metallopeptidase [Kiritimatiellaeota bacterium]|nr:M4 family metallopeptidase [Kiritimatiellota bacterium]